MINLFDNTPHQPSKFITRNQVEINDKSRGTNDAKNDIKFTNSAIRSSLCAYSDGNLNGKGTTAIQNTTVKVQLEIMLIKK